jgi:hypothetical protein
MATQLNSQPQILPLQQDIQRLQNAASGFPSAIKTLDTNRKNIGNKVGEYSATYKIVNDDKTYDFDPAIDNYGLGKSIPKNTRDVNLQDTKDLIIQQNTTYVIGTICASVILIAGIMIGSER